MTNYLLQTEQGRVLEALINERGRQVTTPGLPEAVPVPARQDLGAIAEDFARALTESHLSFGRAHERIASSFVASLATKRFVILTGLSGSGKTQIALRFGDWLGEGRSLIVAVGPDWTGSEALFGYCNTCYWWAQMGVEHGMRPKCCGLCCGPLTIPSGRMFLFWMR